MDEQAHLLQRLADLRAEDQRWLMANMTPAQRRKITAALARGDLGPASDKSRALTDRDGGDVIADADADDVAGVLAQEPAWVIAALLARGTWPWRDRYLASLDDGRREDVMRALPNIKERVAPAAMSEVVRCTGEKLWTLRRDRTDDRSTFEVVLTRVEQGMPLSAEPSRRWSWRKLWSR